MRGLSSSMARSQDDEMIGLVPVHDATAPQATITTRAGVPTQKPWMTWTDYAAITACLACFAFSVVTVYSSAFAMYLGQTKQLVVVGFLLSLMALCTQKQALQLSLLFEVHRSNCSIQNIDGLLRNNIFGSYVGFWPRLTLLSLQALPLALSASYKLFAGGFSTQTVSSSPGFFGITNTPGYQHIGQGGLSHLVKAYVPFYSDPGINRTYGFNMFVLSDTTTALLDAPFPDYVAQIQSDLSQHDTISLTATVNATVSESIDLPSSTQSNLTWWEETYKTYDSTGPQAVQYLSGTNAGMLMGANSTETGLWSANVSRSFLSLWNASNETFESKAQQFITTRRLCTGTWTINRTQIILQNAEMNQTGDEAIGSVSQEILRNNQIFVQIFLGSAIMEFNKNFQYHITAYNFSNMNALAVSMIWGRLVSWAEGWLSKNQSVDDSAEQAWQSAYWKDSDEIKVVKSVPTLKQSGLLLLVLVIHPFLTALLSFGKTTLYNTPIGDGFGIVSLLAGYGGGKDNPLHGASISGRLNKDVKVGFEVVKSSLDQEEYDCVRVHLEPRRNNDKLVKGRVYA